MTPSQKIPIFIKCKKLYTKRLKKRDQIPETAKSDQRASLQRRCTRRSVVETLHATSHSESCRRQRATSPFPKSRKTLHLTPYNSMGNNPVSMVDPDGDLIFSAIAIGAFVNFAAQTLSGNVNSIGDAFGALGIGAAALEAKAGISGILAGAAYGAGSGAVVGGVSGGLNSFLNDEVSFQSGLGMGGLAGGISGGISGGIFGGIDASKANAAETYNEIAKGTQSLETKLGYSARNAKAVFRENYGEIPSYILDIKAKEIPTVLSSRGFYFDPGYNLRNSEGILQWGINGITVPSGFWLPGGRQLSTMYLLKPAFSSKNQLISTLGHELYHSTLLFNGVTGAYRHHAAIGIWQQLAHRKNNLDLPYYPYAKYVQNFLQVRDLMHMPKYKF